jgi:ABC-type siderophore export system fused ATPase/permease subunit
VQAASPDTGLPRGPRRDDLRRAYADQDKDFRDRFYREILPELKARGKTLVVVSHDDRYWHLGDRVVAIDLGKAIDAKLAIG